MPTHARNVDEDTVMGKGSMLFRRRLVSGLFLLPEIVTASNTLVGRVGRIIDGDTFGFRRLSDLWITSYLWFGHPPLHRKGRLTNLSEAPRKRALELGTGLRETRPGSILLRLGTL